MADQVVRVRCREPRASLILDQIETEERARREIQRDRTDGLVRGKELLLSTGSQGSDCVSGVSRLQVADPSGSVSDRE